MCSVVYIIVCPFDIVLSVFLRHTASNYPFGIRSLKKFIFRYQYLVEIYSVSAEKIISDAFSYSENV